jgi:hypothetical protein
MHDKILDDYFWHYVDLGMLPKDTPLFTNIYLVSVIAAEYQLSHDDAALAFENAQKEVQE